MAGIEDEGRTVVSEGNGDVGGLTSPQEACVDEDVEDDEAQLLVQAIGQWWPESTASRRRSSDSGAALLGFRFAGEAERERGGKARK